MTHADDRKNRRRKRRRWHSRGGGGVVRTPRSPRLGRTARSSPKRGRASASNFASPPTRARGAIGRASGFWQLVIGLTTLAIVAGAVLIIVYGIFFAG
jgi:hypothetical protein